MRALLLQDSKTIQLVADAIQPDSATGEKRLSVMFCGICRTDARMWQSGHRDLVLPRVLGHEIAAWDDQEQSYCTVWPGIACGKCFHCREGSDNLCESIQILGFHRNGGFAEQIVVPEKNIVYSPGRISPELLCFAEPIGCVANALSGCRLGCMSRVIIYGGGVLGMLTAIQCRQYGADIDVIERSPEKIEIIQPLCKDLGVYVGMQPAEGKYDLALNCCDAPEAFINCLESLRKGGQFRYFSGVRADSAITADSINAVHYKELEVRGCYGPRSSDMATALEIIKETHDTLPLLIEDTVSLNEVKKTFQHVNSGMALKYIVDIGR